MADIDSIFPSLSDLAKQEQPLFLPWGKLFLMPGSGFNSNLVQANSKTQPWTNSNAFMSNTLYLYPEVDGGVARYREARSSQSGQSMEHFSTSLGATVGYAFLSGNVTGAYDEAIWKDSAATMSSRNIEARIGRVTGRSDPKFSWEAKELLANSKDAFRKKYGDYFVSGYDLGVDIGACISMQTSRYQRKETKEVTGTISVFWWSKSTTKTVVDTQQSAEFDMTFRAYDTMRGKKEELKCKIGENPESLRNMMAHYMSLIDRAQEDALEVLAKNGFVGEREMKIQDCSKLCSSGVVAQVILTPYSKLPAYQKLTMGCSGEEFLFS